MSVATWNYLNPFFSPEHDDSTLWTEDYTYVDHDDNDEDYTYYTLGDDEDDTMATGAYTLESRLARALPLRPNTAAVPRKIIQRHKKKKQRIVLEARKAVPAAVRPKTTRAPDAPATTTTTTTAAVPNFLKDWLNASSCRPKPDPSAGKNSSQHPTYASRFTGDGLPQAPSHDYEDESQLMATFDLPRPPSLVYKYKVVVDP